MHVLSVMRDMHVACLSALQHGASKEQGQVLVQEHVPKVKVGAAAWLPATITTRCLRWTHWLGYLCLHCQLDCSPQVPMHGAAA